MDKSFFQHLSLDDTLSRTVEIYTKGFVVFALVFICISRIVMAILMYILRLALVCQFIDQKNIPHCEEELFSLLIIFVPCLVGIICNGAFMHVVGDIYLQRKASFGTSFQGGLQHAGSILTASFLVLVGILLSYMLLNIPGRNLIQWSSVNDTMELGTVTHSWNLISGSWWNPLCRTHMNPGVFLAVMDPTRDDLYINAYGTFCLICLYLPGIYLIIQWLLFNPVIVVERLGAVKALKRSWALVSGSWCYVFATYIILGSFLVVLNVAFDLFGGIIKTHPYVASILGSIPTLIAGPMFAIMMFVMYINLRVKKEGLSEELFACKSTEEAIIGENKGVLNLDLELEQSQITKRTHFP